MNHTKASCGHLVIAVGMEGSPIRREIESSPCSACRAEETDRPVCSVIGCDETATEIVTQEITDNRPLPGGKWEEFRRQYHEQFCSRHATEAKKSLQDVLFADRLES